MGFLKKFKDVFGHGNKKEKTNPKIDKSENEIVKSQYYDESIAHNKIEKQYHDENLRDFRYLDNLIHSGSKNIVLDSDIVLSEGEESKYSYGIDVDVDNLVIDGNGYCVDARKKSGIFYVSGKNVIIKNITLKNGSTRSEGGALLNEGKLRILNATLSNNYSDDGGALNNFGSLEIVESSLLNNSARLGGAIYNEGGEIIIEKSTFSGNSSKEQGGVIDNGSKLTVLNSTFSGNSSVVGGVIHNRGELNMVESILKENSAEVGGAIHNKYREAAVHDCTFTENNANSGGAISNEGHIKVFESGFVKNRGKSNVIHNRDSFEINDSIFNDNVSSVIVLNDDVEANFGIFNTKFHDNLNDAVFYNTGKSAAIGETTFENNLSSNSNSKNIVNLTDLTLIKPKIKDEGLSILNADYLLIKMPSPDIKAKIEGYDPVIVGEIPFGQAFDFGYLENLIHSSDTNEIILDEDITFENYEKDFFEGGIELDIDNLTIDGNGKTIDGANKSRIFIITGNNITLKNIIFKNGYSHKNYDNPLNESGAVFRVNHGVKLTVEDCQFINNNSENKGGVIYTSGSELNITNSILKNNVSKIQGGVIYNKGSILNINNSDFADNSSKDGGVIYNNKGNLTIYNSTLLNNSAQDGGVVLNAEGTINVGESIFSQNNAKKGVVILNSNGKLSIYNSNLCSNSSESDGGAIYSSGGEINIVQSKLNDNDTKERGGAIYLDKGLLSLNNSHLMGNASKSGGAVYNDFGKVNILESKLNENEARWCGGAIYTNGGILNINDSHLNQNVAKNDFGGAIHNSRAEIGISRCELSGNSAGEYGGVIHNNGGKSTISESRLSNNTARLGGVVYNKNWELYLSESLWSDYAKKYEESGSMHTEGEVYIKKSTIDNNLARDDGGVIYNMATFNFVDCNLKDNNV